MVYNKNTLGVIIGRFQTPYLHNGHTKLINHVYERHEKVLILLGTTTVKGGRADPLDYETRRMMLYDFYPKAKIKALPDYKSDNIWSSEVDKLVLSSCDSHSSSLYENAILYGSRDSFIPHYTGGYPSEMVYEASSATSATFIRNGISKYPEGTMDFRKGVVYGAYNRYDVVYPTVDIAVRQGDNIILGRKLGEEKLRFIGGFVDPKDDSLEEAALRELREEAGNFKVSEDIVYLGSFKVDDWRLKKEKDSILTSFFYVKYIEGDMKAGDDIAELHSIPVTKLTPDLVEPEHRMLMQALIDNLTTHYGKLNSQDRFL